MIQHDPWIPTKRGGIEGQNIAIVGYSHHHKAGTRDHRGLTRIIVRNVINGEQKRDSFFPRVPEYFGCNNPAQFWSRVLFFNFLPCSVGTPDQKYVHGTKEQLEVARIRFRDILAEHQPQKVFVFTTKGWNECPCTVGECIRLNPASALPAWGEYRVGSRKILACGFPHPQFADRSKTTATVHQFLRMS
jgi:hypothetical protein